MSAAGIAAVNTVVATDTDLVAAVREGEDSAFEELYRRYYLRIAAFVRGYLRDAGRAEDVTQEAFMSALRRLRQTDSDINFKPWIFEIARNAAIDQYRRSVRTDEVSIDLEGGFAPSDVTRVVRPQGPDSSLLDKQRLDHLRGALDELSDTHHKIIVMRELEGLSYREIGEKMELTPAAVESTLFRARRKLEHEYSQLDTGRRCQHIGAVIGRLAEGLESERDRRRLDRHARRCSNCRRRSRQLGVEPILPPRSIVAKAAAIVPLPLFLRRRFGGGDPGLTAHAAGPMSTVGAPALEAGAAIAGKAVAVVAAVAITGAGGATLGGAGPLDLGGNGGAVVKEQLERGKQAPDKGDSPRGFVRGRQLRGSEKGSDSATAREALKDSATKATTPPAKPKPAQPEGIGLPPGLLPDPQGSGPEAEQPPPPSFEEPRSEGPELQVPEAPEAGASAPSADGASSAVGSIVDLD